MTCPILDDPLSVFRLGLPLPALSIPPIDTAVVLIYLLGTVAVGLWVGRGQKNLDDYLLGDRDLPWPAVLGSIVATETSTATFLSVPALAFAADGVGDLRFLQLAIGYILGRIVVAWLLLPLYFRGKLYTSYEVLNQRFGGATKSTASVLFLFARTIGDGLRLFLAGIALAAFVQVPLSAAIWVMGLTTIIYTVFGGMRSVVWNDCIQLIVYIIGGGVIWGLIAARLPGGIEGLWEFGSETGRLQVFDFRFDLTDPYVFWAGLFGGIFLTLGTHGTDQLTVQRLLSARRESDARKALIASGFVVFAQCALFLLVGVALAAYYQAFPRSEAILNGDKIVSMFIAEEMPPGLAGLLLAAVFAAAMSTLSSSLNSSAASTLNDLLKPILGTQPPSRQLQWGRALTVLFGLAQISVGLVAPEVIGWLSQTGGNSVVNSVLAIASFTTGLILGVFFLGIFTKRAGQWAALSGMLVGAAATGTLFTLGLTEEFGRFGLPSSFKLAWPWYTLVGSLVTFGVGSLVAGLYAEHPDEPRA